MHIASIIIIYFCHIIPRIVKEKKYAYINEKKKEKREFNIIWQLL